ncbi:MAG: hypothetical protein KJ896_03690, partial [Nanoarchaeota archaeon]|nr:hypothetical protein [Nanoarchaeota archaeon]
MTQMGKRGIDVSRSSSRSRVRSAFNGLVKLGLVFLVVVLLSNVVVAKDFDATVTKFHQCLNSENGIMDSQHLCLKDSFEIENGETAIGKDVCFRGKNSANEVTVYDEEVCESTACLDTSSGREEIEVVHRINQMYAELFHDILVQLDDQGVKDEPNTKDVRDAAAITAELFFGNGDYCGGTSDHTECEKNDGFATDGQNGDNNPGNENEQPTASSACLRIKNDQPVYSIDVDDWGVAGPDKFGFEETGKDKFSELSTVPLVLKCYSEEESKVHPWGEGNAKYFDIRGGFASDNTYPDDAIEEVTEGLFVSQKFIYTDPNSSDQITKYNLYFCENGQWKDYDYIKNLDDDGDGAPGEYGVVWDCDDNNPTVAPDYSAFEGLVSNPIEVCGDGKSNFCENSTLYEEFYDAYESIYEDWPNTYSEEQDDCDYNPWACENNCLFVNNHCDYLDYSSIDEESEEFEQPSMAEGFCCGADQIEDLGRIADPEFIDEIDESKVCLHKDNEYMVGGDLENLIGCEDNDEWCWAGANTNGFKIFTIKEVGIEPFDIISNTDDWYSCNENTTEETLQTPSALEDRDKANRFMCYDQGDRFVWAECADPENAGTVKHRLPGDGTYMLANFMEDGGDIRFDDYSSDTSFFYKQDLVKTQFVDFKEYDFIEFYAAINEIPDLPADVRLQIYGKNDVIYFDEQVLGYSVNAPLMTEGNQIHVKVPIGGWLDVELINIYGEPSSANIDIKNVYLSKEGEETPICSGYVTDSVNFNSWLENLDQSEEGNEVVGDKICMEHFGEDAWLGHSDYNEVDEDSASCCGNTASEYYAGLTADNDGRGCWNSEVVNNDETAMNVEYDLTYSNNEYVVEYPVQEFDLADTYQTVSVEWECDVNADLGDYDSACDQQGINCQNTEIECSTTYRPSQDCIETYSRCNNLGCASREFTVSCTEGEYADNYISVVSLLDEINFGEVGYYGTYPDGNYYEIDEGSAIYSLSYNESPMVISETEYSLNSLLENSEEGEFTFTLPFDQAQYPTVKVYYFLPGTQRKQTGNEFTVRRGEVPEQFTLQIIAETDEMTSTPDPQTVTESFNHACLQDECIFGLPGIPPYYITNLHPGLYELYYITGSNPEDEVLVTTENQQFNDFANLKVKKLSQQVLYSNQTFYGCNAASFIADDTNIPGLENVNYCTAQGSYYCAYQDDNYLINTWSNVGITEYGYEEIAEYEEDMEFEPASCLTGDPCAAEDLNFSTHIVPGRNFINNPDFEEQDNNDVIGWELLDSNNYLVENEDANAADGTFNIPSENTLRTERLALYPKMDYVFTQASSCIATLKLYDKDGAETITSTTFNSTDNTYIVIEFAGSCSLSEPMLQLVDDLGAKEFDAEDTEYPLRKAAACCPEGWCWNGYLCV